VREDYSANGDAWSAFPHEQARSRAYRWGEDGLAGISDNHQRLCFALALWNGKDAILKERLFGVTGPQGNHGEDVKELYYYLDSTPTHSYMKFLYKYPQRKFPYDELVHQNGVRSRDVVEYELLDTDIFEDDRYWDIFVEVSHCIPTSSARTESNTSMPKILTIPTLCPFVYRLSIVALSQLLYTFYRVYGLGTRGLGILSTPRNQFLNSPGPAVSGLNIQNWVSSISTLLLRHLPQLLKGIWAIKKNLSNHTYCLLRTKLTTRNCGVERMQVRM
jgi:hypothetical protein